MTNPAPYIRRTGLPGRPTPSGNLERTSMSSPSAAARDFNWLLTRFVNETADVQAAIAVSADGILLAHSQRTINRPDAEQLAAIVSGLNSLAGGAARCFDLDDVTQIIVEMRRGYLFSTAIGLGSSLGVLADAGCDIGVVAYEMTMLVHSAGTVLTPALIDELKNVLVV